MQFADYFGGKADLGAFTSQPLGSKGQIRNVGTGLEIEAGSSFEGYIIERKASANARVTTGSLWNFYAFLGGHLPKYDLFETRGGGRYEVPLHWWTGGGINSPFNRRVQLNLSGNFGVQRSNIPGKAEGTPGAGGNVELTLRPGNRLQIGLGVNLDTGFGRARWVATDDEGTPIFSQGEILSTDSTISATLGLTPRLTLQSHNQLFHSTVHHEGFYRLTSPDTLEATAAGPYDGLVDQALTALTSNTILRWEYWPGSFLFMVYTHRSVLDGSGTEVRYQFSDAFTGLGAQAARHEDIVFLKLVHLFAL
jgi:hypothetical protein